MVDFLTRQLKRLRWEDSDNGDCIGYYLEKHNYLSQQRSTWYFAGSCFLYSLIGLHTLLHRAVLDRAFPELEGWWYWEGIALLISGPISYWNDVYCFGLDKRASTIDRLYATSGVVSQMFKIQRFQQGMIFLVAKFSIVVVALVIFFVASNSFARLLDVAGQLGRMEKDEEQQKTCVERYSKDLEETSIFDESPTLEEQSSKVTKRTRAPKAAPSRSATRNVCDTEGNSGAGRTTSTECSENTSKSSTGDRSPAGLNKIIDRGIYKAELRAILDSEYDRYLRWHTAWHVSLPLAGFIFITGVAQLTSS